MEQGELNKNNELSDREVNEDSEDRVSDEVHPVAAGVQDHDGELDLSFNEEEISSQSSAASTGQLSQDETDSEESNQAEMPTKLQLAQREKEIKLQIKGEQARITKYSSGATAIPNNVKNAIARIKEHLVDLEALSISRIAGIVEESEQDTALTNWYDYKDGIEVKIIDAQLLYDAMPGAEAPPLNEAAKEIAALKAKLEQSRKQTEDQIGVLKADFDTNWTDEVMNKLQFAQYTERIAAVKKNWEKLDEINTKLCRLDLDNAEDNEKAFVTAQKNTAKKFHEMTGIFAAMKIPEETLNLSASILQPPGAGPSDPNAQSTNLNRSLVSIMSDAGLQNSHKAYRSYKNEEPPTFNGDPSDYPLWRREWQNAVCVNRDDAWVIRNIYEYVKVPGDKKINASIKCCRTQVQVWELLNRSFANATIVTNRVLSQFMALKKSDLEPHTPQSQLVALNLKVQQLVLNLEAVKRESQFKSNPMVLSYAIKLLPQEFCTEFSKERQKAERSAVAKGESWEDEDLAKLLMDFLNDYTLQFREFQPETLLPPKGSDNPGAKLKDRRNNNHVTFAEGVSEPDDEDDEEEGEEEDEITINSRLGGSGDGKSPDWGTMVQVEKVWATMGKCPVPKCGQKGHFWTGNKGVFASDQLTDCPTFRRLPLDERMALYKKLKLCRRCTSRGHQLTACSKSKEKLFCRKKKDDGTECKADHATLFHGGNFKGNYRLGVDLTLSSQGFDDNPGDVMLAITTVTINNMFTVVALLDNGSNSSLITHTLANQLKLKGHIVMQEVELCGMDPEMQQVIYYNIKLTMPEGDVVAMRLIGVEKICSNPGSYDVSVAYRIFPHHKRPSLDKPDGEVQLLIGADQIRFMPSGGQGKNMVGNLRVYDIPLPPYVVLVGSHPEINVKNPTLTPAASQMRKVKVLYSLPLSQLPGSISPRNNNQENIIKTEFLPAVMAQLDSDDDKMLQDILPTASHHNYACPRNLKVPACVQQDDEMVPPPAPQPVPQPPNSEVSPESYGVQDTQLLQINHQRQRRAFTCWQCCHRVFQRDWALELESSQF